MSYICDPQWESQAVDNTFTTWPKILSAKSEGNRVLCLRAISTSLTPIQKIQTEKSSILGIAKGKWKFQHTPVLKKKTNWGG